ncbi:MAG TPA: response regulator transcription factor [Dehalococcoidia bacterium]|nr:response regulator transcription factor [Dehalococcoidia bacterium]
MANRVFLACDHSLVRHALGSLLRRQPAIEVCGESTPGTHLVEEAAAAHADLILLTVESAERATAAGMRSLYRALAPTPVVLLNLADDDERLLAALSLGVRGIIDKDADTARLISAIQEVLRGEVVISKRLASRLVVEYVAASTAARMPGRSAGGRAMDLSEREREVLSRLARGESNRSIAESMFISVHTVRAHARSLMQKLHVRNRVQAARYAFEHGLVEHDGPQADRTERKSQSHARVAS